jgi:O-antigen ligase
MLRRIPHLSVVMPASLCLMWGGLLWSRALLSIAMGIFIISSLLSEPLSVKLSRMRSSPFLMSMALLFLIPFVTVLWSDDLRYWVKVMQDKTPLLLIPLCAGSLVAIPAHIRRGIALFALSTLALSMGMALAGFLSDATAVTEAYLRAKVMRVDMGSDHIRYAWMLSAVLAWLLHVLLDEASRLSRREQSAGWAMAAAIVAFLHLLASKTGLLACYLCLGLALLYHRRRSAARWLAAAAVMAPLVAWLLLPTFRNRLRFILWDFQNYSRGGYTEGLSDTPRVLSLDAAWDLIRQSPWLGTGFGDLRRAMTDWYVRHAPFMQPYEYLLPSNEAVLHAAAAGIPLALVFAATTCVPLLTREHRRSYGCMAFHAVAFLGLQYEVGLETQYGIFIYAVMGCWGHMALAAKDPVLPSQS